MNRLIAVGALVLVFGPLPAMAQTFSLCVRVGLHRPNCENNMKETVTEVTNLDPNYWYKVAIVGKSRVAPPGPSSCNGTPCESNFNTGAEPMILQPRPQFTGSSCKWTNTQLPSNAACKDCGDKGPNYPHPPAYPYCGQHDCDNRKNNTGTTCPDCEPTCDKPSLEWCMELVEFQVTIVAYSANGVRWTNTNQVVATKNQFGSSGFSEQSYCSAHAPIFEPCSPAPDLCISGPVE